MIFFILILILSLFYSIGNTSRPDAGLTLFELADLAGYPIEKHDVITEDGYILGVHRIPYGIESTDNISNRPPILLVHGMGSCAEDWMNQGPQRALAYLLADAGHDVWMLNQRGNFHSRRHQTLDPDANAAEFWSFSWDEMGRYDLPATIDYILKETNREQLQYVGYSQGGTVFAVMASTRPEYNAKIKFATLLAPAIEMTHVKNQFARVLAPFEEVIYTLANFLGIREFLPRSRLSYEIGTDMCDEDKPFMEVCEMMLSLFSGDNPKELDASMWPVFLTNTPAGINFKQVVHYMQLMNANQFQPFDYHNGAVNKQRYGVEKPLEYDLGKITAPVVFFSGKNDLLTDEKDIYNVAQKLRNSIGVISVGNDKWTHLDVIWATHVREYLYDNVIRLIEKYK